MGVYAINGKAVDNVDMVKPADMLIQIIKVMVIMGMESLERGGVEVRVEAKVVGMAGTKFQIGVEAEVVMMGGLVMISEIVMTGGVVIMAEAAIMDGDVMMAGVVMMVGVETQIEGEVGVGVEQILLLQPQEFVINGKRVASVDMEMPVDIFMPRTKQTGFLLHSPVTIEFEVMVRRVEI